MDITYVFAGLVVANRDQAAAWYERLLGRPPDFLPNDAEVVWQLADTASVYLLADADRAGRGVTALVVDDLDASLAALRGQGAEVMGEAQYEAVYRLCSLRGPAGIIVALARDLS